MLTRNGKFIMSYAGDRGSFITSQGAITGTNAILFNSVYSNWHLACGNGTMEPTAEDIGLESKIDSISILNTTRYRCSSYSDNYMHIVICVCKNTTSEDITVSEIGLIYDYNNDYVLFAHEIITPVTIKAGKAATFIMSIGV